MGLYNFCSLFYDFSNVEGLAMSNARHFSHSKSEKKHYTDMQCLKSNIFKGEFKLDVIL